MKLEGPCMKKKKLNNELVKHDVKKSYLMNFKDKLTVEQREVVDAVNANNNIFFTGKYFVFNFYHFHFCKKYFM